MLPVENADKVAEPESNYNSVQTASQQVPDASKSNLCFIRKKNILQEIPSSICVFFHIKLEIPSSIGGSLLNKIGFSNSRHDVFHF